MPLENKRIEKLVHFGSPSSSADLFIRPGSPDKRSLISSIVPETGAYYA